MICKTSSHNQLNFNFFVDLIDHKDQKMILRRDQIEFIGSIFKHEMASTQPTTEHSWKYNSTTYY